MVFNSHNKFHMSNKNIKNTAYDMYTNVLSFLKTRFVQTMDCIVWLNKTDFLCKIISYDKVRMQCTKVLCATYMINLQCYFKNTICTGHVQGTESNYVFYGNGIQLDLSNKKELIRTALRPVV